MYQSNKSYTGVPTVPTSRHGGKILADQLAAQGTEAVFCVAGESFLPALDGLYDQSGIRTVSCRHESGAAIMAEAWGKMTGRPAVAFVTRGPGATNACLGVHIACQDSTPMVLMIGQVQRSFIDREAFQEIDFRTMFRPLAKLVEQVDDTSRIPEYVSRAWHTAMSGRPGPVVLIFPEDVLYAQEQVENLPAATSNDAQAPQDTADLVAEFLHAAQRPLVIVGGGGWSETCCAHLTEFVERNNLPVVAEFRCQDYIDNRHPNYIGDLGISTGPRLAEMMRECDHILCIGARLGELPTQKYSLVDSPKPNAAFFHVHADVGELGRVFYPSVAVNSSSGSFIARLRHLSIRNRDRWRGWTERGRQHFIDHSTKLPDSPVTLNEQAIRWLRDYLPHNAIIASGSGISSGVLHRYYYYGAKYRTQLAPATGSMGYSVPAAIAAKMCAPERKVVCIAGDGCFLMTGQEMATAAMLGLDITYVVVNNGVLGTIRKYQESHYPGRVIATDLVNPDFSTFARSFGAQGYLATSYDEFVEAFKAADSDGVMSLVELLLDRDRYVDSMVG
ncbi:MAG: thiamine pyrophosphate-binding protein [Acidiferrobacterales bacterium]|nr:thiamine pyrophosphate-binding protein [Acidiferrobacterales bacterium]